MGVLNDDFSVGATLAEDGAGIWSSPKSTATASAQDFKSLYEQQRARADAAEARCEELRQAEVSARSGAGYWKCPFKSCRRWLSEAGEETKALSKEVARLHDALAASPARRGGGRPGTPGGLARPWKRRRSARKSPGCAGRWAGGTRRSATFTRRWTRRRGGLRASGRPPRCYRART